MITKEGCISTNISVYFDWSMAWRNPVAEYSFIASNVASAVWDSLQTIKVLFHNQTKKLAAVQV